MGEKSINRKPATEPHQKCKEENPNKIYNAGNLETDFTEPINS